MLDAVKRALADYQTKEANLTDEHLNNIPKNQKLVIQQIISAAKKTDSRGNRYSEEFIMLCMLLNIRSKSDYEQLRSLKVLPLPCTKTIRDYMSLIDLKCGFDDNFFKLLKQSFSKKKMIQNKTFHGDITVDKMSLRTSVSVKSKTLTYSGLVDMGEDGEQSSNIEDLADHGLGLFNFNL